MPTANGILVIERTTVWVVTTYSASKAARELAIESWRVSFCGEGTHQTPKMNIATARAGNVIGGGDWSEDRIVPDMMRSVLQPMKLFQFATQMQLDLGSMSLSP